jgi:hypothetical protein
MRASLIAAAAAASTLAVSVLADEAQATTIAWSRIGSLAGAVDIAGCSDGRVYARVNDGSLRLNRNLQGGAAWERVGALASPGSLTCAGNVLYHFDGGRRLYRNDGGALSMPNTFVGNFPNTREIAGGTTVALVVPVPTFARLDLDGSVHQASDPAGAWTRMGTAGGASHLAVGGGFLEWRAYAQNADDSVWENAGQACDEYWRRIATRATLDDLGAFQIDRLIGLDDNDSIHLGTISHERREFTVTAADLAARVNPVIRGSTLRAHGASAVFTPSAILRLGGMAAGAFPLSPALVDNGVFGSSTYTPNDINLTSMTLGMAGSNVFLDAVFEEAGLELISSNRVYPDLNISPLNGRLTMTARVGTCGQPQFEAASATFNGNFSGQSNLFSFVVDLMNGDIRNRVHAEMLTGARNFLAQRGTQVSLQQAMLGYAQAVSGGAAWSHIVGNTFSLSGGRLRFSVER